MKVKVVYDQTLDEDEIILYARKDANNLSDIINSIQQLSQNILFPGKYNETIYYLKPQDIICFRIENKILNVITAQRQYTMNQRLYEIKAQLNHSFLQISKSEIINVNFIDYLTLNKNGTIEIRFTYQSFTYSSRRYLPLIKEALKL
ncbi:LytTR family DNA-binding domain-containing protein [Staphylococcus saprophyticus]|nr:LytTR family DNA-binding domain-containing protein [Staphylococcus saprophyticus]MDW4082838.1 LytTR family DNA-binding domain-containing protein [Staphylococcus saprophyticus]